MWENGIVFPLRVILGLVGVLAVSALMLACRAGRSTVSPTSPCPPDIMAAEIAENLEAALEQFAEIHEHLRVPATD